MTELRYPRKELLRSHPVAREHRVAGRLLHGGFDRDGRYLPPRLAGRAPALAAWTEALRARGGDLLAADASLLAGVRGTNEAQQKLLLQEGLGQTFWNLLGITGEIEGRGRVLAELQLPGFADAVVEPVASLAIGHLNGGLLEAHGFDEGGDPRSDAGGHDAMWYALRDLAFGPVDFPPAVAPERIGRPDAEARLVPEIPARIEGTIAFLMNLLLIEFRAALNFDFTERLLRDPELFRERRAEAELAADVVDRIRIDEVVHVESLRLYLGELRSLTFRAGGGRTIPGRTVVGRLWDGIVHWWTVLQPPLAAAQQRALLRERIQAHPEAGRVWERFEALADPE